MPPAVAIAITTRAIINSIEIKPRLSLVLFIGWLPQASASLAIHVVLKQVNLLPANLVSHGDGIHTGEEQRFRVQPSSGAITYQFLADHRLNALGDHIVSIGCERFGQGDQPFDGLGQFSRGWSR